MRSITIATIVAVVVVALLGASACSPAEPTEQPNLPDMICINALNGDTWVTDHVRGEGSSDDRRVRFSYQQRLAKYIPISLMEHITCYPIPEGTSYDEIAQRFRPASEN